MDQKLATEVPLIIQQKMAHLVFCVFTFANLVWWCAALGEWAGRNEPLRGRMSNTTRISHTRGRIGRVTPSDWKLVNGTRMDLLLPKYDTFQTLLSNILKDYNIASANKFSLRKAEHTGLQLECGGFTTGGQDAFALGDSAFSVADGVGGSSVSPSNFSRSLAEFSIDALKFKSFKSGDPEDLIRLAIREAHVKASLLQDNINNAAMQEAGVGGRHIDAVVSSTLLVGSLDDDGKELFLGNVGDGGTSVYRRLPVFRYKRGTALQTEPKVWNFNQPRQLDNQLGYSAEWTDFYRFPLREGDLILAASDGLIDNLYLGEVDSIINRAVSPYESRLFSEFIDARDPSGNSMYHSAKRSSSDRISPGASDNLLMLPSWPKDAFPIAVGSPELQRAWRYTTPPGLLAKYLVLAARWESAFSEAPCPFSLNSFWWHGRMPNLGTGKPDDVTATACWVVSTKADSVLVHRN